MANSSDQTPMPATGDNEWNYHNCPYCHKRVPIDENLPGEICLDCNYGFYEFGAAAPPSQDPQSEDEFDSSYSEFDEEEDDDSSDYESVPPSLDPQSADDFIGTELNISDDEEEDGDEEIGGENNEGTNSSDYVRIIVEVILLVPVQRPQNPQSDENEEHTSNIIYEVVLLRPALNGLSSNSETDYVADVDFDQILNRLAEAGVGSKGAPPAAKSVVSGLPTVEILTEADAADCTICQDVIGVGELMKKLPCGHGYHGDCITTWLGARNSCPVCRFELPTDDVEYEEMRKSGRKGGRAEEFGF